MKMMEVVEVTNDRCLAGLGAEQVRKLCPRDIEVACRNGPNFCTLSGPAESMTKFVKKLQEQGVFAKEVNCGNIAYHSKYISSAGPLLLKYLKQVKCINKYC
jgi:fatty acid synthase